MNVSSSVPLEQLIQCLEQEPKVWVRLASQRSESGWRLGLLEMTAGEAPPSWQQLRWLYDSASFVSTAVKGTTVARWFESRRLRMGPLRLDLGGLAEQVSIERRESFFAGLHEPLAWPSEVWRLTDRTEHTGHSFAELVANDAPAFLDFDRAAAYFLGLGPSPNRNFSGSELVFRHQDRRARITSVQVGTDELRVLIEGDGLAGSSVHLGANSPGEARTIRRGRSSVVRFPLAVGLPPGA